MNLPKQQIQNCSASIFILCWNVAIILLPASLKRFFLSAAHTEADIAKTLSDAESFFQMISHK